MSFVKVPVQLLECGLSANEMKLFVYLLSIQHKKETIAVRIRTIQQRLDIASHTTVQSALRGLEAKGLLTRRARQDRTGRKISSCYKLTELRGAWFPLDIAPTLWKLGKSSFSVYLYMIFLCRANSRAWPSYTALAKALHMAKNTIITAVKELIQGGFLLKSALWKGKHNLYTLFAPSAETGGDVAKEKAAATTQLRPSQTIRKYRPISNFILYKKLENVNPNLSLPYVRCIGPFFRSQWFKNQLSPTGYRFILYYQERNSNIYVSLYPVVMSSPSLGHQCATVYCAFLRVPEPRGMQISYHFRPWRPPP